MSKKRSYEAASAYKGQKVCVHNFASATMPGGGVVKGSSAQEECLCRTSTLYFCINTQDIWDDKLPSWQKRGIGMWNEQYEKEGYNPITKENVSAVRSRIHVEYELPLGDAYADMVAGFVKGYEARTN